MTTPARPRTDLPVTEITRQRYAAPYSSLAISKGLHGPLGSSGSNPGWTWQVILFDGSKAKDLHPQTTAMKSRIDSREGRLLYSRRLGIVEPVFGNLHNHHLRRFTLRTRRKVDTQWKLSALGHNVQKAARQGAMKH
jgi:hypothetical protein